jgi:hypothetical protein
MVKWHLDIEYEVIKKERVSITVSWSAGSSALPVCGHWKGMGRNLYWMYFVYIHGSVQE